MTSTIADDLVFIDTNVLVYAYDVDAVEKHTRAQEIILDLWQVRTGVLSTQVLQEFYVTVTAKLAQPLDHRRALQLVRDFASWPVRVNTPDDIVAGAKIAQRAQLSFWDGLIVNAAKQAGARRIYSEDLQAGRMVEGILVVNPFV
jgi:predicted nucleic acid-binding protein